MFDTGSHLQTLGKTTTSHVNLGIAEPEHGGLKVKLMRNGSHLVVVPSYGFMENVSVSYWCLFAELIPCSTAGAGKSVIWYDDLFIVFVRELILLTSSTIIEDIRISQKFGLASLAFFYCDFRNDQKKDLRGLLTSLLVQLGDQSKAYYTILSNFYVAHGHGSQHAGDGELLECLKSMLRLLGQPTVHIIIDAIDECPAMTGLPSPREEVLELVEELVNLHVSNLVICVTSRLEADIISVLGQLPFRSVSLHDENGQIQDMAEYIKFQVRTDFKMRTWRTADKELVIDVLTKRANGM